MTKCAGVILAGGHSTRMGQDKAELSYQDSNLLEFMEDVFHRSLVDHTYISRAGHIPDIMPNCGPLGGIHAVLTHDDGAHDFMICAAIDMPQLTPDILNALITAPNEADLVCYRGHKVPFRMRTQKGLCRATEKLLLEKTNLSLGHFQDRFENKLMLDVCESAIDPFININTEQEWAAFKGS